MEKYLMKFNFLEDARVVFCIKHGFECTQCPIFFNDGGLGCYRLVRERPDKAAKIMGLKVINEEDNKDEEI